MVVVVRTRKPTIMTTNKNNDTNLQLTSKNYIINSIKVLTWVVVCDVMVLARVFPHVVQTRLLLWLAVCLGIGRLLPTLHSDGLRGVESGAATHVQQDLAHHRVLGRGEAVQRGGMSMVSWCCNNTIQYSIIRHDKIRNRTLKS